MKNLNKLYEGLDRGDLNDWVSETFTIDRFRSKMGEDTEIVVVGFKVKDKYPAIDLMEFIERGYKFILDSDMSAGEEQDGTYHVFVEIPRTPKLAHQLKEMFDGISQLCNCHDWKFNYQKSKKEYAMTVENIEKEVPLSKEAYERKILEIKNYDIKRFFDQGATEVTLDENNNLTFTKPFSGQLDAKFLSIGNFNLLKSKFAGPLSLDESSQSQVLFLSKYLGAYDIDKIGDVFLIRNGNRGLAFKKERW